MPLKTQSLLKDLLSDYYLKLEKRQSPIAWCTSVGPAELLRSFGYEVYFPENHGALIGARRQGAKYIPMASAAGFSPDICSYLTSDVGAFLSHETPLDIYGMTEIPKPDVLVYNTCQCREVKEWFSYYAEQFNAPIIGINTPRDIVQMNQPLQDYLESQWQEIIRQLEHISGKSFNLAEFQRIVGLSEEACRMWQAFLNSNNSTPALHNFFDHIILMAPVVVLRGTTEAVDFYKQLLAEVKSIDSSSKSEKYRFYWEGMPIWGKIKFFAQLFAKHGISVVSSTYCHSWAFDFDKQNPLSSSAFAYGDIFITRSQERKLQYLKEECQKFSIDTILFHDSKTCPYNTNNRFGIPQQLKKETGIPFLTFCGDLVDLRLFSEQEFTLRLEAFIEQIGE
jgi:benzoyl-CoA reductase/2-hydroxyglutaryl-CoA dehydratase subunit BcrC/BadD/HgdB